MKRLKLSLLTLFYLLFSITVFAQGDSCVTAEVITMSGTYSADGPSSGGNSTYATNSDWYTFTAPSKGKVTVSSCQDPSGTDTRLWFHSGTCAALIDVASNDDLSGCSPLTGFASQISDIPVTAGTTYFIEWDDNWTSTAFEWDFTFVPAPATDVGVVSIQSPNSSGCGLSNATPVMATVGNYGTDPVSNIDMSFLVDGNLVASEVLAGPLNPGNFASYTFTATADLSGLGDHLIDVIATHTNDGDLSNGASNVTVTNFSAMASGIPITEDFNSYADGDIVFVDFENLGTAELDWQVLTGPTGSVDTGPSDDVSGGGKYIYMETSSPAVDGDRAILVSKCIDLSSGVNPRLEFSYHMYGASIKSLEVGISVAGVETSLFALSGQQQTATTDPWLSSNVDLTPYVGSIIQLIFTGTTTDDGLGTFFYGDIGLDNIFITDPLPSDLGVVSIDTPVDACGNSAMDTVSVSIQNFGSTDESGFDVSYTLAGPTGPSTVTETYSGTITAGSVETYTFMGTADLSMLGTYTISSTTSLSGDSNTGNDGVTTTIVSGGSTPPIFEDFDSYPVGEDVFPDLFNDDLDQLDWTVNVGGTPSTATGPDDDVSGGGGYIFVETSGAGVGNVARICTNCVNLNDAMNPRLEFSYHLFGGSIDSLIVYVDDGTTVSTELALIGQQQTANADPWLPATVDLTAYSGSVVTICFEVTIKEDANGDTFNGDAALDEISIIDPLPNDVGVSSIDSPSLSCTLSAAEDVTVTIENYGSTTETGFDITYDITGPGGNLSVTENVGALSIAPGASATYTFTGTADMSALGSYDINAFTALSGDPVAGNDTTMVTILTGGSISSLSENFDTYAIGETVFANIQNDPNDQLEWEVNTGSTTSTDTGPNQDASGSGNYIYVETSSASDGDIASICTECIDLSSGIAPQLEFSYHLYGGSIATFDVTIDDGSGSTNLLSFTGQQQTANADPWTKEIIDLTAYAGSVVSVCFTGSVKPDAAGNIFNGDMALDNIVVREPPLCADPYNVLISPTDVTADVSWTGGAGTGILEYGPTGFTPGTGTMIDPATNPQTISGLMSETTYQVYITEDCGSNGLSIVAGPTNFTTQCSPFPFPGNEITNPIVAPPLPYTDTSSTASCYSDNFGALSDSPDVFYSFTTDPCANSVTVSLCNSAYDTRLSIINPVDSSILFTNDDFCGTQSEITFTAAGNTTYYAVVEGFGTTSFGEYFLSITEVISTGIDAVAAVSVDPSCPNTADGAVNSIITGGASPFTYTWSNGATTASQTGLMAGTYDVTVSDNCGGLSTASVTLVDPAGLTVDAGAMGSICLGESYDIGGMPTADLGNPFPTDLENAFGYDALNGVFYKHDLDSPDMVTDISVLTGDYFAGDFGPDGFYALEATTFDFVKIDTATGTPAIIGTATANVGHSWTGLAWDGANFHALSTDGVNSQLYSIDIATGAATATFTPAEPLLIFLAIDNNGNAYTMDIGTDSLYTIDLATGGTTPLGATGFDANFAQDADFDPKTNTLYIAGYNGVTNAGELRTANLVTGNTTMIGAFPNGGEVTAYGIADLDPPNSPYNYMWSPSSGLDNDTIPNPIATPTSSTTYVVAVSDACGNTVTNSVFVEIKPLPNADAGSDVGRCDQNPVVLTASGGIVYSWSTGETGASISVSPTVTTIYTVTVTDANCSATDNVTVTVATPVVPTITINVLTMTSSPAASYQWFFDMMPIPGATGQTYTATENGVYTVETVDANGCSAVSDPLTISTVSITEIGVNKFNAYPNPTGDLLTVDLESVRRAKLMLKLVDVVGRVRHEESLSIDGTFSTVLDMEQLPAGIYILQLKGEEGTAERRIVKQ